MRPRFASRLEAMIARLAAQRIHLDEAAALLDPVPGPVIEVGLGKGRTYDHVRTRFAGRAIYVFDGAVHAPAELCPPQDRLILGDFRETLPAARRRLPPAALVHADIGSDDPAADAALSEAIAPVLADLVAPAGLVLSDRPMPSPLLTAVPGPRTAWPYYRYRHAPA